MPIAELSREELEKMLSESAERGARRAVIGLLGIEEGDKNVARDFQNLRELLSSYRAVRAGALTTLGRMLVIGAVLLFAMVATKFSDKIWSFFSP